VLVGGEAGAGKTMLTNWLAWLAEEKNSLTVAGGCYDLSTPRPYQPWAEIIGQPVNTTQPSSASPTPARSPTRLGPLPYSNASRHCDAYLRQNVTSGPSHYTRVLHPKTDLCRLPTAYSAGMTSRFHVSRDHVAR
jgi:hypothetical protein